MSDFSQLLTAKADTIVEQWVQAVSSDRQITSTDHLSHLAIRDHIPHVLAALATVLAKQQTSDVSTIVDAGWKHGTLRAEQGFDPTEIAREYHLLRTIIVANLRSELVQGTPEDVLRAVSLIDMVVDAAIAQCFKSYVNERLQGLEQMQSQLALTNQELSRLIRASQDNLSLLAHEFKTPLTSIIGYSELFLNQQKQAKVRDTVTSLEHIERVLRNGRHLLQLINDTLELSRYEAGKMQLRLVETEVKSLLHSVLEVVQPLADARALKLTVDCDLAPVQVVTDALRLQQVISNLVSNAIRYTEEGSVTIACQVLPNQQWAIAVSDTGIGITPDDQNHIFDPFYRAISEDTLQLTGSTGLGLAIVARLVALLQGSISVQSQVGLGSTFTVVLPIKIAIAETMVSASS